MDNWYTLSNTAKWGISEIQKVVNRDLGVGIKIDTNWKWGTFDLNEENPLDIKSAESKYQEDVDLYAEFDDAQVNYLDSGTEEITFWDVDFTEEIEFDDSDRIIEEWEEEGWNAFDDNGFTEELDPEMWVFGGIKIEESENPFPEM